MRPSPLVLLVLLRLILPLIIFVVGLYVIFSPFILVGYPRFQKNAVGGLFVAYAIFRWIQAIHSYTSRHEEP